MRDSFILYTDIVTHVSRLNMDQRGVLFTAILMYERGERLPEMDDVTEMCFSFIQASLDREAKKYDAKVEKRREAANARWMQEHANDANASDALQTDANDAVPVPLPDPSPFPLPDPAPSPEPELYRQREDRERASECNVTDRQRNVTGPRRNKRPAEQHSYDWKTIEEELLRRQREGLGT